MLEQNARVTETNILLGATNLLKGINRSAFYPYAIISARKNMKKEGIDRRELRGIRQLLSIMY